MGAGLPPHELRKAEKWSKNTQKCEKKRKLSAKSGRGGNPATHPHPKKESVPVTQIFRCVLMPLKFPVFVKMQPIIATTT